MIFGFKTDKAIRPEKVAALVGIERERGIAKTCDLNNM